MKKDWIKIIHNWGMQFMIVLSLLIMQKETLAQSFESIEIGPQYKLMAPIRVYGAGISFYDINGDGLDDISVPNVNDSIFCLISNGDQFSTINLFKATGEAKMMLWGDIDNDGDADLLVTYHSNPIQLYRNNGDLNLENVTSEYGLNMPSRFSYGASFGDINKDGFLDIVVNNYNFGTIGSWLFINHNGQNFTEEGGAYGLNVSSDASFQSTIIDLNGDGWQDIHVANDRYPRDAYLISYQDYFVNEFASVGLDIYCNSMSSSFADYDHDLDMDFYVSNTTEGNFLWQRQEDDTYLNVAEENGVGLMRDSWGAQWVDYNNDSWEDLYVNHYAEELDTQPFFMNVSGNFQRLNELEGYDYAWGSYASAKGDFNGDGFYDLVISGLDGEYHKILKNTNSENNYVKIKLEGVVSNRDGIGTWINYSLDGNNVVRYTKAGDGYLTQDSQWIILGIGEAEQIDELTLTWLSGQVDTYTNIPAQSVMVLKEGFQHFPVSNLNPNELIQLCANDQTNLEIEANGTVIWNNGEEGNSILAAQTGEYFAMITNEIGIVNYSDTIYVEVEEEASWQAEVHPISCYGNNDGAIFLSSEEQLEFQVSDEAGNIVDPSQLSSGIYNVMASTIIGCHYFSDVIVVQPMPINFSFATQNIACYGVQNGAFEVLENTGGTGVLEVALTLDEMELNAEEWNALEAGVYAYSSTDEWGCVVEGEFEILEPAQLILEVVALEAQNWFTVQATGGTPPYELTWNEEPIPNNYSVMVEAGEQSFQCTDGNGCSAFYNMSIEPPIISSVTEDKENTSIYRWTDELFIDGILPDKIVIFDQLGKRLTEFNRNQLSSRIPIPRLAAVALIFDEEGTRSLKILGQ